MLLDQPPIRRDGGIAQLAQRQPVVMVAGEGGQTRPSTDQRIDREQYVLIGRAERLPQRAQRFRIVGQPRGPVDERGDAGTRSATRRIGSQSGQCRRRRGQPGADPLVDLPGGIEQRDQSRLQGLRLRIESRLEEPVQHQISDLGVRTRHRAVLGDPAPVGVRLVADLADQRTHAIERARLGERIRDIEQRRAEVVRRHLRFPPPQRSRGPRRSPPPADRPVDRPPDPCHRLGERGCGHDHTVTGPRRGLGIPPAHLRKARPRHHTSPAPRSPPEPVPPQRPPPPVQAPPPAHHLGRGRRSVALRIPRRPGQGPSGSVSAARSCG
ncbi:hypothetical protein KHQ06_31125 [Nocardia tengchongensis]|uniref:Uncharacterized protein n=1 Tax=Nocardia tengchongensis TaxID=2055889 RepID=A0ABX8CKV2_9NOCA|nr:hypothetical protein [Nocardia tengchongensis]QVI20555.1 hypothetical protein KHQ06_31125 [Nocardia tengchongensis]